MRSTLPLFLSVVLSRVCMLEFLFYHSIFAAELKKHRSGVLLVSSEGSGVALRRYGTSEHVGTQGMPVLRS